MFWVVLFSCWFWLGFRCCYYWLLFAGWFCDVCVELQICLFLWFCVVACGVYVVCCCLIRVVACCFACGLLGYLIFNFLIYVLWVFGCWSVNFRVLCWWFADYVGCWFALLCVDCLVCLGLGLVMMGFNSNVSISFLIGLFNIKVDLLLIWSVVWSMISWMLVLLQYCYTFWVLIDNFFGFVV